MDLPLASGTRDFVITWPLAGTADEKNGAAWKQSRCTIGSVSQHVQACKTPKLQTGGFVIRWRKLKNPIVKDLGRRVSPEAILLGPQAGMNASIQSPSDRLPTPENSSPRLPESWSRDEGTKYQALPTPENSSPRLPVHVRAFPRVSLWLCGK
jgi:hypothetical protein